MTNKDNLELQDLCNFLGVPYDAINLVRFVQYIFYLPLLVLIIRYLLLRFDVPSVHPLDLETCHTICSLKVLFYYYIILTLIYMFYKKLTGTHKN
jgi:hypothetical protein